MSARGAVVRVVVALAAFALVTIGISSKRDHEMRVAVAEHIETAGSVFGLEDDQWRWLVTDAGWAPRDVVAYEQFASNFDPLQPDGPVSFDFSEGRIRTQQAGEIAWAIREGFDACARDSIHQFAHWAQCSRCEASSRTWEDWLPW